MGRMLKALQQVGTTPRSSQWHGPVSHQELKSFGLWRPAESHGSDPAQTQDAGQPEAVQPVDGGSPVALLHSVEETIAAELTAEDSPRPQEADSEAIRKRGQAPCNLYKGESSRTASGSQSPFPDGHSVYYGQAGSQQSGYRELAERILSQASFRPSAALVFAGVDEEGPVAAVAAELAAAVAARVSGQVLLVDADFHRPRLADWFGVGAERSLADVFLGVAHWEHAVRRTAATRLSLLPGGLWPTDQRPPREFEPGRMLSQIQQSYCLVLVHTGTATSPATDWLGRHADGIHLVVELGRTPRRAARRAVNRLSRSGLRVLGCIVADAASPVV